ncbi:hypothetical protein CSUB01_05822 [Colletotrichum sublineola]|uniref:Uncharacterized protein n=1 Tax=Colletotrichum sublineola TaxID=1173701 RepID=A0A066XQB7_COLSU|nr:hypothetical protein CSUB01_05822 [Colletotrichum sublineola]
MPWLSRSPSYQSPINSPRTSPRSSTCGPIKTCGPSVTYIPPLIDGACGTIPLAQKPSLPMLHEDLREIWLMMPGLMASLRTHIANHRQHLSKSHLKDMVIQLGLAIVEVGMITLAIPLFVVLPGIFFAAWLGISMSMVLGLSWLMNGNDIMVSCDEFGNSTTDIDDDNERWIFIGAIQRCFPFQTQASRALYVELRSVLLDASVHRVAVLAHNNGSLPVANVLARLCSDIQPEKLTKLEIYTFGAAASEFIVPVGESSRKLARFDDGSAAIEERGPHIEHFAYANDPFAQMGVLSSVHKKLESRFCGGVFVIHNQVPQPSGHWVPDQRPVMLLTDYLSALFPDPSSPHAPSSILDYIMMIDRDMAEKRELAAMANHAQTRRSRKDNRRLSWTGLGATVGGRSGVMDGVMGLEMVRRGCRDCDGHRGREVSWLANYVQTGWVVETESHIVDAMGIGGKL